MKYAIVFVLTNTSKYAYVGYHCIYAKIRSYLCLTKFMFNLQVFFTTSDEIYLQWLSLVKHLKWKFRNLCVLTGVVYLASVVYFKTLFSAVSTFFVNFKPYLVISRLYNNCLVCRNPSIGLQSKGNQSCYTSDYN